MKKFTLRLCNTWHLVLQMLKTFKNSAPPRSEFKNFYYTPHDKFLFWVAGYTRDENTNDVSEKVFDLARNAQRFADHVGCHISQVRTFYNDRPPRYQYMRVFYIQTEAPHPDAYVWNGSEYYPDHKWTMNAVLTS